MSLLLPGSAAAAQVWLAGVAERAGTDYQSLFRPAAPWQRAAAIVRVFKISTQHFLNESDVALRQMIDDLNRRGIALAAEGLMVTRPATCGHGVEGYSSAGEILAMARRIKKFGGTLAYVAMDEPLWYGHHYAGREACRMSIADVAKSVAGNVAALRSVFPDVVIGDIEPITATSGPDWLDQIMQFAEAYRAATGSKLDFVHADMQWSNQSIAQLRELASRLRAAGIKMGVIYDGNHDDPTDIAWTRNAESRFAAVETYPDLVPDQAIIQSWMPHPSHMLPETRPGTMTYLVDRYALPETILHLRARGSRLDGWLTRADGQPISGVSVSVRAVDTSAAGVLSVHTLRGVVPDGAASALIGLRINTECDCSGPANLTIGPMEYGADTAHMRAAPGFPSNHFVAAPGQRVQRNTTAFAVRPGGPFVFRVPMHASYSARDSGYIGLFFLDGHGREITRFRISFQPTETRLGTPMTDANGHFSVTASASISDPVFTADFAGNAMLRMASATTK